MGFSPEGSYWGWLGVMVPRGVIRSWGRLSVFLVIHRGWVLGVVKVVTE